MFKKNFMFLVMTALLMLLASCSEAALNQSSDLALNGQLNAAALTSTIEITPSGMAPKNELLDMEVSLISKGVVVQQKKFFLDGATYICARFSNVEYGTYTVSVDFVKNGYRYSGNTSVTVNSANTVYQYLYTDKTATTLTSAYSQVYLRGTLNSWGNYRMTLVSSNNWQITVPFAGNADDRFKFDINANWSLNFGDNDKNGIADQNGADIYVTEGKGSYLITFNDQTKAYTKTLKGMVEVAPDGMSAYNGEVIGRTLSLLKNGAVIAQKSFYLSGSSGYISVYFDKLADGDYTITMDDLYQGSRYTGSVNVTVAGAYTVYYRIAIEKAAAPASSFSQVYFRGTPNNWGTYKMSLVANNQWKITAAFGTSGNERFKFDINGDWSLNFGDSDRNGIAEQNGADIPVANSTLKTILFNDLTKAYTVQ